MSITLKGTTRSEAANSISLVVDKLYKHPTFYANLGIDEPNNNAYIRDDVLGKLSALAGPDDASQARLQTILDKISAEANFAKYLNTFSQRPSYTFADVDTWMCPEAAWPTLDQAPDLRDGITRFNVSAAASFGNFMHKSLIEGICKAHGEKPERCWEHTRVTPRGNGHDRAAGA